MDNQTEIETLEKAYSFFYGQAEKVFYIELLKELYQDINQAEKGKNHIKAEENKGINPLEI